MAMAAGRLIAVLATVAALALVPRLAAADSIGGSWGAPSNSADYAAGLKAAEAGHYQEAVDRFESALKADPKNANTLNELGYCNRKLGNLPVALDYYNRALAIDPKHRGAHEYLGELYLQMNDPAKAQVELKTLDDLCTFGCEEYDDLKKAITAYNAAPH
jgi:tetratricopeptide (TPR) repeat protein